MRLTFLLLHNRLLLLSADIPRQGQAIQKTVLHFAMRVAFLRYSFAATSYLVFLCNRFGGEVRRVCRTSLFLTMRLRVFCVHNLRCLFLSRTYGNNQMAPEET